MCFCCVILELFNFRSVDTVVAIERTGPSADGTYRTMKGYDMTHLIAPLELLFIGGQDFDDNEESNDILFANRPKTVGIGDGGNEVGMGKVLHKILPSSIPNAMEIACIVPSDHLIVASVSNWGGYALAAATAVLSCNHDLSVSFDSKSTRETVFNCLPSSEKETELCQRLIDAGARDGVTKLQEMSVDGMPLSKSLEILEEIRKIAIYS